MIAHPLPILQGRNAAARIPTPNKENPSGKASPLSRRPPTTMGHDKGKKRKLGGGDTSSRSDPSEQQLERVAGNQIGSSMSGSEGSAARSVYIVVNHLVDLPAYSLYKVDCPNSSSGGSPQLLRPVDCPNSSSGGSPHLLRPVDCPNSSSGGPRELLRPLATLVTKEGKTFTSVQTEDRMWIVGVGGDPGLGHDTIIFDTKTEEVIRGPDLRASKFGPALLSVGNKIFALSRAPLFTGDYDIDPWFVVLDLTNCQVVDGQLKGFSWKTLRNPPCFPGKWHDPMDLIDPPAIFVDSYVVVGSYILVSLRLIPGTYAFNTELERWQLADSNKLPFKGRAVPHSSGVFLGMCAWEKPQVVAAYHIELCPATSHKKNPAIKLSITRSSLEYNGCEVATRNFSSLDKGSFCSLRFRTPHAKLFDVDDDDESLFQAPNKAYMTLRTYQMENLIPPQPEEERPVRKLYSKAKKAFKIRTSSYGFVCPAFVTALSV